MHFGKVSGAEWPFWELFKVIRNHLSVIKWKLLGLSEIILSQSIAIAGLSYAG